VHFTGTSSAHHAGNFYFNGFYFFLGLNIGKTENQKGGS
jgi:hypothetical protein